MQKIFYLITLKEFCMPSRFSDRVLLLDRTDASEFESRTGIDITDFLVPLLNYLISAKCFQNFHLSIELAIELFNKLRSCDNEVYNRHWVQVLIYLNLKLFHINLGLSFFVLHFYRQINSVI